MPVTHEVARSKLVESAMIYTLLLTNKGNNANNNTLLCVVV
jgi:hypothetical protein